MARQDLGGAPADGRLAALLSNGEAVGAMVRAVEGTLGPRGLDVMLVDRSGQVIVTNDGITILTEMEATHPAARMVVHMARAQERAVGDGTTTATVIAGALLAAAVDRVVSGVPVARIIEGVRLGIERAREAVQAAACPIDGPDDPRLLQVARVAARGDATLAGLAVAAARLWGPARLADHALRLADCVVAAAGPDSELFAGVLVNQGRMNKQQPAAVRRARILVFDDALAPPEVAEEALATAAGFRQYQRGREQFLAAVDRLPGLGVNVVVCDRAVDDEAAERLTDAGVMVLERAALADWRRVAEYTGARVVRRAALLRPERDLARCLGRARLVREEEGREQVRISGGGGRPMATLLVGAATPDVAAERERIARDAAAAVQAALRGGVVAGGGAAELAAARAVARLAGEVRGMAAHGLACVADALKRPLAQMVTNAGFNPLEKVGDAWAAQEAAGADSLAIDCATGELADMWAQEVTDPAAVKLHALSAAGELATAILRIDTIIERRAAEPESRRSGSASAF